MTASSRGRMPAAVAAMALALGILLASSNLLKSLSPVLLCALAGTLLAPATVNLVYRRAWQPAAFLVGVLVDVPLLAALALGGGAMHEVRHRLVAPSDVSNIAPKDDLSIDVRILEVRGRPGGRPSAVGQLATATAAAPRPSPPEPAAPDVGAAARGMGVRERPVNGVAGVSGLLWLSWPEEHEPPRRGELVRVTGTLRRSRGPRNPGSFDFARYLSTRGIRAVFAAERTERLASPRGAARAAAWVERTVREKLADEPGALLTGLLLGRTSSIPDGLLDSFRRSGTVHVLAVSGLHVGFIGLVAYAFFRLFRVPARPARLLVLPCLVAFVALVGPRPSVVRASIMAAGFVVAWSLERNPNPLNTIGLAAIAILVVRPGALSDLGFGLSFGATTAIVVLFPMLRPPHALAGRLGRAGRFVADSLTLSVTAQLGVAPVLVAAFGQVSIAAALANIAVVPLAGFSVVSGMAMLASVRVPAISRLFAASAFAALRGAAAVSTLFAQVDAASLSVPTRLWPAFAAATLGLGLIAATLRGRVRRRATPITCAVVALSVAAIACALAFTGPGRSHSRLVVFDVGQGDAILLEIPKRRRVLIDAGDAWNAPRGRDAGRDVVVPYLRAAGTGRLDALVVTHAHRDHFGGARSVLTACGADGLVLPRGSGGHAAFSELAAAARAAGSSVSWAMRGDTLLATRSCTLAVLWPPETPCASASTENDRSIVIRVGLPGVALLLTGDIEAPAEGDMVSRASTLRADVLKVPHHGSATSSCPEFIEAVRPRVALVSAGAGNRYGHPDAVVLSRFEKAGTHVLRTDRDGAIIVDVLDDRIVATGFASGRRVILRYERPPIGEGPTTAIER